MPDLTDRFSPKQIAQALGVGESTVKRWVDAGKIEAGRTAGGHRRVAVSEVLRYVQAERIDVVRPQLLGLGGLDGAARLLGERAPVMMLGMLHAIGEALESIAEGVTISDATRPDNPLVFANASFYRITGYEPDEVVGRNCRFLQGPDTDPKSVASVRQAVARGERCVVEMLNYRKTGDAFMNRLSIVPVQDAAGTTTHFVGIQSDLSAEK